MATFVNDTMVGTAGTLLESHTGATGATWAKPTGLTSGSALLSNANRVRCNTPSGAVVGYYASGVPAAVSYNVQADLFVASLPAINNGAGLNARMLTSAATYYLGRYAYNTGTAQFEWQLWKSVAGTLTLLGTLAETLTVGSTVRMQLQVAASSQALLVSTDGGTTWTTKVTTGDADAALSAAGLAGVHFYSDAVPSDTVGLHLSNLTATDGTAPPAQTIPVSDAHLFFSPYNWYLSGSTYAQTTTPGAYLKTGFGGTSVGLALDVSPLVGASVAAGNYPTLAYSVDNGVWTTVQLTSGTAQVTCASGLAAAAHTLEARLVSAEQTVDRWTTPVEVLRITGLLIDLGSALAAPSGTIAPAAKRLLVYGDSITEGINTDGANDSRASYAAHLGLALGAEWGQVGFGRLGWGIAGNGSVPMFYNTIDASQSWNKYFSGQSRLQGGLLSPTPDYICVVLGTNDSLNSIADATVQSAVSGWLSAVRAAAPTSWVFVVVPFGGHKRTPLAAAVAAQSDQKVALIDLGGAAQTGLAGPQGTASQQSSDSIHPRNAVHARLGAALAAHIQSALGGAGGVRRVGLSGGIGG